MSMSVGSAGAGSSMCEMNTTPLIDVMLVLLVTLILSLPIQTHAVKLDMPPPTNNPPPPDAPPEIIDLDVDFDGTIAWNGQTMTLDELNRQFKPEAVKDPQPEIHFRPDRQAKYDVVARVLAIAQRNKMTKIGFVNTAEFAND
jgi:biopolymer transport protein ExbD